MLLYHSTYNILLLLLKFLPLYFLPQELFNKFQSLVLPEAVNFLLSEDESVLEMINEVANFTLTSYPGENIRTALKSLADGLRERSLKVILLEGGVLSLARTMHSIDAYTRVLPTLVRSGRLQPPLRLVKLPPLTVGKQC